MKIRVKTLALLTALAFVSPLTMAAEAGAVGQVPVVEVQSQEYLQTIRWDAEYDVVVLGYGFAGSAAAIAAADAGAHVLLAEKAPEGHEGGNSRYAAQHSLYFDPKVPDEKILKYMQALRGKTTTPSDDVYRAFIREGKKQMDYLRFLGVKEPGLWTDEAEYPQFEGSEAVCLTMVKKPGGDGRLYRLMQENVRARKGIEVWFNAPGVELLQDRSTGIVHGVVVNVDGARRMVRAKNGVILATGGYENNPEMFRNFGRAQNAFAKGAHYNTGDGIVMAMDVKANIVNMAVNNGPDPNVINPKTGNSFGYMVAGPKDSSWSGPAFTRHNVIMVGEDGRRFWNEAQKTKHGRVRNHGDYAPLQMPERAYMIFDETARLASKPYGSWSDGCEKEIAEGLVVKAATLSELAERVQIDVKGLEQQVAKYNADCEAGVDTEFARPKALLKPLLKAPFYAVEVKPTYTNTQGGPERNERGQVLDRAGKPIPHLYAAGELGSIFSHKYNGGGNIAEGLIFGRLAGADAALVKKDVPQTTVLKGEGFKPKAADQTSTKTVAVDKDVRIGRGAGIGGPVVVAVKLTDGKISQVRVVEHHETEGIGTKALDVLPGQAVANNGKVDAVSGATVTSEAFKAALEDALK